MLGGNEFLSPRSWLTLARSFILMDDLTKAEKFKQGASKEDKLIFLNQAHSILIAQVGMLSVAMNLGMYFSNIFFFSLTVTLKPLFLS